MMGRLKSDQGQLFYEFHLGDAVPEDHLVRKIDAALDLSWLRSELAAHYSWMGRPSIDPELMIRMLVVGYVFAIRSERLICREVQVNLAYRWFCKLGLRWHSGPFCVLACPQRAFPRGGCLSSRIRTCRRGLHCSRSGWWRRFCGRREPDCGRCQQAALDRRSGLAQGSRSQEVQPRSEGVSGNP
jgi:hypothetical protein